jgi:hypothetical protein
MARAGDVKPRSNQRQRNYMYSKRLSKEELDILTQAGRAAGFQTYKKFLSHLITEQAQTGAVTMRPLIEILSILNVIVSKLGQIDARLQDQSQDVQAAFKDVPIIMRELAQASEMIYRQIPRE